jgi:uncharacterized protein (DUF1697 family)
MGKYISLLRGINISGQKLIKMKDLTALYISIGFQNVETYLQSGNVLFYTELKDFKEISGIIEQGIKKKFGFDVSVLIKTGNDFKKIIKNNPYLKKNNTETEKIYVTLLFDKPERELLNKLTNPAAGDDEYSISGEIIYINCPDGYGRTKINNNFFEKKLNVTATTRNWNTVNMLLNLSEG